MVEQVQKAKKEEDKDASAPLTMNAEQQQQSKKKPKKGKKGGGGQNAASNQNEVKPNKYPAPPKSARGPGPTQTGENAFMFATGGTPRGENVAQVSF